MSMLRRPTPKQGSSTPTSSSQHDDASVTRQSSKQRQRQQSSSLARVAWVLAILAVAGLCYKYSVVSLDDSDSTSSSSESTLQHGNIRKRPNKDKDNNDDDSINQCSIYFAPSSLKGLDGYGIFTTRNIPQGATMLTGPDGPSIPLVDYTRGRWTKTWNEYLWERGKPDHVSFETDGEGYSMDFQFGFGSMPNHHCILNSLQHRYPTPAYDDSLVNTTDPGMGAFSYSMGREFVSRRELQAGEEIYLNYGYCHRGDGASHTWPKYIPMLEDYNAAALIAWAFYQIPSHVEDVTMRAPKGTNEFVASLLPKSTSQLRDIVGDVTIETPQDLVPLLAKYIGSTPRTPAWIRNNGICLSNLLARKSLIPHAGQGAFAQYPLRKGEIVVPAPLIHIEDGNVLGVYDDDDNLEGIQLLLNYCFGHAQSSLLLCPETNALLINHCSNRKKECGPDGPNAMYRWSTGWEPRSDEWRKLSVDEIAQQSGRGLSMEIVALRDISPGEEVTFDYGLEWEIAWAEHVKQWKPPRNNETTAFVTAKEANEQNGTLTLLVSGDLRKVTDHSHLFTGCQYWNTEQDKDDVWYKKEPSWVDWKDEDILHNFADDGSQFQGDYATHHDRSHWPCTVIRQDEDGTYTVRIHQADWTERETKWHRNRLPRLLTNYPRESIHYFVKPFTSDQYYPGAFRHPLVIRDEIFPEQWKNRKQKEGTDKNGRV